MSADDGKRMITRYEGKPKKNEMERSVVRHEIEMRMRIKTYKKL